MELSLTPSFSRVKADGATVNRFNGFRWLALRRDANAVEKAVKTALPRRRAKPPG